MNNIENIHFTKIISPYGSFCHTLIETLQVLQFRYEKTSVVSTIQYVILWWFSWWVYILLTYFLQKSFNIKFGYMVSSNTKKMLKPFFTQSTSVSINELKSWSSYCILRHEWINSEPVDPFISRFSCKGNGQPKLKSFLGVKFTF